MSMGDQSRSPDRPRWRDDPTIGRTVRPGESAGVAPTPPPARSAAPGGSLDIARDSDVPISTQLYWQLAYQIDTGRFNPGSRLPTVRELGAILHVNPNTVRAVYKRLAEAGYVVSRQGAGTRVTARAAQRRTRSYLESARKMLRHWNWVHIILTIIMFALAGVHIAYGFMYKAV